jgi:hypothetical protein
LPRKTPIIVAISGGASRAGLWGAAVLARVDAYARERNAAVYAVSSVSGGSLGAAAYLSALAGSGKDAPPGTRCWLPAGSDQAFQDYAMHLGRADAIGPLLAGYVFSDVPRAFAGWPAAGLGFDLRGGDRAAGIERAFEANERDAAELVAGKLKTVGLGEPFMSVTSPGQPLWIANGTERDTGSRAITIPVVSERASARTPAPDRANGSRRVGTPEQKADWPFLGASDVIAQLCRDVPISTAINNTARFPFLEPAGLLRSPAGCGTSTIDHPVSVIDGGYFDNSGLESALELAGWLEATAGVKPIVVATSGDGDSTLEPESTVRCGSDTIDPGLPRPQKRVLEVLGPVFGLYNARSGHVDVLLRRAAGRYCDPADLAKRRFFHFYLPARGTESVPLNWVLSRRMAGFVWDAVVGGGAEGVPGLSGTDKQRFSKYLDRNRREVEELKGLLGRL